MTETIEPQNTSTDELRAKVAEIKKQKQLDPQTQNYLDKEDEKRFSSFEYWAKRGDLEKEAQDNEKLSRQQVDDVLDELNRLTPKWLTHTFDSHRNKVRHSISSQPLLEYIQERTFIVFTERYPNGIEFIGTHWREIGKMSLANALIENAVITALQRFNLYDMTKSGDFQKHLRYVLNGVKRYQNIKFGSDTLVNFKNRTLNLDTGITHAHTFDDYLIECLPIDYVDSDDGGLVLDYAKHLLGDEAQTLAEWFGYMFYNDMTTMNHILFIQGVGGNGKSTLLNILAQAFGEFASGQTLSQLTSPNEGSRNLAELFNKRANIIAEAEPFISPDALMLLKKLTSGDMISANPKNKDVFTYRNKAKFIVSANRALPNVPNEPEYQRRFVLLSADAPAISTMPNPQAFKEKYDKDTKLPPELPKFVSYAIKQAKKALERRELTILPATKSRTDAWLADGDYIQSFIDNYMPETIGMYGVSLAYLLERFNEHREEDGEKTLTKGHFRKELEGKGLNIENSPRKPIEEDGHIVDNFDKKKRNRVTGRGYLDE